MNPNLIPYRVTLFEEIGDKFMIVFDCMAEDDDHAEEQALDAYPAGEIFGITFFPDNLGEWREAEANTRYTQITA